MTIMFARSFEWPMTPFAQQCEWHVKIILIRRKKIVNGTCDAHIHSLHWDYRRRGLSECDKECSSLSTCTLKNVKKLLSTIAQVSDAIHKMIRSFRTYVLLLLWYFNVNLSHSIGRQLFRRRTGEHRSRVSIHNFYFPQFCQSFQKSTFWIETRASNFITSHFPEPFSSFPTSYSC